MQTHKSTNKACIADRLVTNIRYSFPVTVNFLSVGSRLSCILYNLLRCYYPNLVLLHIHD